MNKKRYKLDNAALIYPSIKTRKWMATYRVSALLNEKVDPEVLQAAADDVLPRFPTMKVGLRKGFFWHYFEENAAKFKVEPEINAPCQIQRDRELFVYSVATLGRSQNEPCLLAGHMWIYIGVIWNVQ